MESPLSAREFLQRFHLPQLVRLSTTNNKLEVQDLHARHEGQQDDECQVELDINRSRGNSNISSSLSALASSRARQQQQQKNRSNHNYHEPSNWTYRRPGGGGARRNLSGYNSWNSEHELSEEAAQSGSRSLQVLETEQEEDDEEDGDAERADEEEGRFCHSFSAWSSVQVDRMLQRQHHHKTTSRSDLLVRVPRASLVQQQRQQHHHHNNHHQQQQQQQQQYQQVTYSKRERVSRKSVEFKQSILTERDTSEAESESLEQSIRLTPASRRPILSKLQLSQPFLLYKAYKKLELCAYVIDPKNELNDKSGDPIYFPHNYPGWFSLLDSSDHHHQHHHHHHHHHHHQRLRQHDRYKHNYHHHHHQHQQQQPIYIGSGGKRKPLESIDQVCRTNADIFLTRDELVGYQLPKKLSHLTKLKNNQLLALPLAINLDKKKSKKKTLSEAYISEERSGKGGQNGTGKEQQASISNIKQIVIKCGQVLKICGIYEDVLPLIERKQQQQEQQFRDLTKHRLAERTIRYEQSPFKQQQQQQQQCQQQQYFSLNSYPATCQQYPQLSSSHQQAAGAAATAVYQSTSNADTCYQGSSVGSQQQAHMLHPPIITRAANNKEMNRKLNLSRLNEYAFSGGHHEASQLVCAAQPLTRQQRVGQRYARCILLSERSLDELTDCVYRAPSSLQESAKQNEQGQERDQEIEVLIPIEQRGRFYLCATNQTILSELGLSPCNLCISATQSASSSCSSCSCSSSSSCSSPACSFFSISAASPFQSGGGAAANGSLVFRLTQIVYLLNLSKRLSPGSVAGNSKSDSASSSSSSSRSSGSSSSGNAEQQLSANGGRRRPAGGSFFASNIRLPLGVELVLGPRPAHFSPSMFGPSSRMESYFRCEWNIAGHKLECSFNRNFAPAAQQNSARPPPSFSRQSGTAGKGAEPPGPACLCALSLAWPGRDKRGDQQVLDGELAAGGLFSASLRIEQMRKRDVLLACTIKGDPLIHLDLQHHQHPLIRKAGSLASDEDLRSAGSCCGQSESAVAIKSNPDSTSKQQRCSSLQLANQTFDWLDGGQRAIREGRSSLAHRLISGRADLPTQTNCRQVEKQQSASGSFKALGKSSFRRLRACRSLISLNGRRKKRPKIPSSMLLPGGPSSGSCCLLQSEETAESPTGGAASGFSSLAFQPAQSNANHERHLFMDKQVEDQIVLLEFDCNQRNLFFARTFLESSIPTSRIPDLVLKRMDFCQRNSLDWERQLKLSYASLSADFDSCKRLQMELTRRQHLQHLQHHLSSNSNSNWQQASQLSAGSERNLLTVEQEAATLSTSLASSLSQLQLSSRSSNGNNSRMLKLSSSSSSKRRVSEKHSFQLQTSTCSQSVNSTASSSSRSSSGVSSSNERALVATSSTLDYTRGFPASSHAFKDGVEQKKVQVNSSTSSSFSLVSNALASPEQQQRAKTTRANSRLLRLMHKILPLSSGRHFEEHPGGTGRGGEELEEREDEEREQQQQQQQLQQETEKEAERRSRRRRKSLVIHEKNRKELSAGAHRSMLSQTSEQVVDVSVELDEFGDQFSGKERAGLVVANSAADELTDCEHAETEDEEEEDDGSHLYESLGRLSESLKRVSIAAAAAESSSSAGG